MALPTYQRQATQVAAPRQTAGGTSTASFTASANASQSLAQRLSSFSSQMSGAAKQSANTEASKKATIDIYKRKQKVNDINANPNLSEDDKASQIDKISEGTDRFFNGVYSRAYESAASSAYSNQLATDAKTAYDLAYTQSGGEPQNFLTAYGEFSKLTTRGAPTVATAILAEQTTTKYGAAGYRALSNIKMKALKTAHKKNYKDNLEAVNKEFSNAYYSGDAIEISRLGALATSISNSAVTDGFISQLESETSLSSMADRAVIDSVTRKFNEENSIGKGSQVYQQFIMAERNGDFETQDPETIAKLKSSFIRQIKEQNDFTLERARFEKETYEAMADGTFMEGSRMAGKGTLTEEHIRTWEAQGVLRISDADSLRDRIAIGSTRKVSDAKALSMYAESSTLIDATPQQIDEDAMLSEKDKTSLIQKREGLLEGRYNWTKTNDGREGIRRIKGLFNIEEGTLMAKIDLDNQVMRDYQDIYKRFYTQVTESDTPDLDALGIADDLIKEYKQTQLDKEVKQQQLAEARRQETAKNQAASANDSIFVKIGWIDKVSAEDMRLEN